MQPLVYICLAICTIVCPCLNIVHVWFRVWGVGLRFYIFIYNRVQCSIQNLQIVIGTQLAQLAVAPPVERLLHPAAKRGFVVALYTLRVYVGFISRSVYNTKSLYMFVYRLYIYTHNFYIGSRIYRQIGRQIDSYLITICRYVYITNPIQRLFIYLSIYLYILIYLFTQRDRLQVFTWVSYRVHIYICI